MIGETVMMRLGDIVVGEHQVRADEDDTSIGTLANSIHAEGLIAPLVVRLEDGIAHLAIGL